MMQKNQKWKKKNTTSNYDKFMTNILDAKIKKKS